jgi:hypothetical protein
MGKFDSSRINISRFAIRKTLYTIASKKIEAKRHKYSIYYKSPFILFTLSFILPFWEGLARQLITVLNVGT